jgi:hypothetical protein
MVGSVGWRGLVHGRACAAPDQPSPKHTAKTRFEEPRRAVMRCAFRAI